MTTNFWIIFRVHMPLGMLYTALSMIMIPRRLFNPLQNDATAHRVNVCMFVIQVRHSTVVRTFEERQILSANMDKVSTIPGTRLHCLSTMHL